MLASAFIRPKTKDSTPFVLPHRVTDDRVVDDRHFLNLNGGESIRHLSFICSPMYPESKPTLIFSVGPHYICVTEINSISDLVSAGYQPDIHQNN